MVGTQDRNVRNGAISYDSPPGVTDAPTSKTIAYQPGRVQVNERSLRLTATDLSPLDPFGPQLGWSPGVLLVVWASVYLLARGRSEL